MTAASRVLLPIVLLAVLAGGSALPAAAQAPLAATVSHVVDGDTVDAQLSDGRVLRVRLIGIDAPEVGECGADRASILLQQIVLGRAVTLVSDPSQGAQDEFGRWLFYVDRHDARDAGRRMLRAGWAEVLVVGNGFERLDPYRVAAERAARSGRGGHALCGGDFSLSRRDELLARRLSAVAFVRRYYRRVSGRRFVAAWGMLGRPVRRELGSFWKWRGGYRRSLGASVRSARARLSGGRAVVSLRLVSRDRDACSGQVVRQHFTGRWVLTPRRDTWVAVRARMRKTGGGRVRLTQDECTTAPTPAPPVPSPPEPSPPQDCQGYDPCLTPGPDVDCAGGSGNGPRYVNGPVYVSGNDPYGLDGDGDGVACES